MASLSPSEILYQQAHAHEDKSPRIIAASAVCLVAAFLAVIFRFVSRRMIKTSLQADDYTTLAALVFTTGFVVSVLISVRFGLGRHALTLTDPASFAK
ncbi:MAG: hypothetical protein LQ345_007474, partial [Seirophora villosa]